MSGRMNQGAPEDRLRRRSQWRTRPLGESEKRWLMGEARRNVQRRSCEIAARGATRCDARCDVRRNAHEVYATPRDSVSSTGILPVPQVAGRGVSAMPGNVGGVGFGSSRGTACRARRKNLA